MDELCRVRKCPDQIEKGQNASTQPINLKTEVEKNKLDEAFIAREYVARFEEIKTARDIALSRFEDTIDALMNEQSPPAPIRKLPDNPKKVVDT